jgi:hypothetical protein
VIAVRGRPAMCVSDNGTELTSMAILAWSQQTKSTHPAWAADFDRAISMLAG